MYLSNDDIFWRYMCMTMYVRCNKGVSNDILYLYSEAIYLRDEFIRTRVRCT